VQSVEQALHLNIELATNRWLTEHEALIPPAVLLYRLYYAVLLGVLVWAYIRHAEIYLRARRTLVAMTGLALLVFWVLPVSPPRFALPGVVDIIAEHDILAAQPGRDMSSSANLTAMPSLHVAWSAWCAYVVWSARRGSHPRAALLAWLFPLAMVADVLATGNHYLLDVAGSAALIIASIAAATGWARLVDRPSKATIAMTDPRDDPTPNRY
jgi:membrane-associated phospholipid phosphatase